MNKDPAKPNEDYFKHVDYIVDKASALGLHIGFLPTWGIYWKTNPENTRRLFTPENARKYGEFLGKRYKDKPVIWILGGDHNPENELEKSIIEAMAEGLRSGDKGIHLVTFHPRGPGRSSDYFQNSSLLDFNMNQSSHAAHGFDNGIFAEMDYKLTPVKPTLDGEPRYENLMVGFYLQVIIRQIDLRIMMSGLQHGGRYLPEPVDILMVTVTSGRCGKKERKIY